MLFHLLLRICACCVWMCCDCFAFFLHTGGALVRRRGVEARRLFTYRTLDWLCDFVQCDFGLSVRLRGGRLVNFRGGRLVNFLQCRDCAVCILDKRCCVLADIAQHVQGPGTLERLFSHRLQVTF